MAVYSIPTVEQYYSDKSMVYKERYMISGNVICDWPSVLVIPKHEGSFVNLSKSQNKDILLNATLKSKRKLKILF